MTTHPSAILTFFKQAQKRYVPAWFVTLLAALGIFAASASAAPKDVRRILAENGFAPEKKFESPVTGYPEPSLRSWPVAKQGDEFVFVTILDPPPSVSTTLTAVQAKELAAILADLGTYNSSLGGKLCVFHTDIAIRVPHDSGGLYLLLCFSCNQIRLLHHGLIVADAEIDRGRNRLLELIRPIFPSSKTIQELRASTSRKNGDWTKDALERARITIPDDPLLKQVMTLKAGEVRLEDLEELDARATASMNKRPESK